MIFGGIDPGKSGAIAFLDDNGIPAITAKFKNWKQLGSILAPLQKANYIYLICEDAKIYKGQGAKSSCTYAKNAGGYEAFLEYLEIPHTLINPKTWQKKILGGRIPKGMTKKYAAIYAQKRWPSMGFKGVKSEEGVIDALCIADFARLTFRA